MLGVLTELIGRWQVEGHVHGEPVSGVVDASLAVGGHWLVARETLSSGGGEPYEDLCLYGRDPVSGDLQVHHFQESGVVSLHAVLTTDDGRGVHWVPRGGGPRVTLRRTPSGWRVTVQALDAPGPEVIVDYKATA